MIVLLFSTKNDPSLSEHFVKATLEREMRNNKKKKKKKKIDVYKIELEKS